MRVLVNDTPIVINAPIAVDLGVAQDGVIYVVQDSAKGKVYRFAFTEEEAKLMGVGLISGAAVLEFQKSMLEKKPRIADLGAVRDFKNGKH